MTAPDAVAGVVVSRLRRYMTPAGYDLAVLTFGADGVADAVAEYPNQLRLAAAELLEGLPATGDSGDNLSSFKLDVLEFKFRDSSKVSTDWLAMAKRLREQEAAGGNGSMMFEPVIDGWDVEP